jgi:hypothetical protein
VTPAATRCARRACARAARRLRDGDEHAARDALHDALGWLPAPPAGDPARDAVAYCLADSPLWSDAELAAVLRCGTGQAAALRLAVEREGR